MSTLSMSVTQMPMSGHYAPTVGKAKQRSPLRRVAPPSPECPPSIATLPFKLTVNPDQSMAEQMAAGQSLRWYGAMACITHWKRVDKTCIRHGPEAYVYAPEGAEPRLLCMLEWKDGKCPNRLDNFNLTSINMRNCKPDAPFCEQRTRGKTAEMLPNDVLCISHWQTVNGRCQRNGPTRYWAVYPERSPVLLREQNWRSGRLDGAEVCYCDSEPTSWTRTGCKLIELSRRHWCNGQLEGPELCFEPQTGCRVERQWHCGLLEGRETRRYSNGRRQIECNYVNGCLDGEWTLWYKHGELAERGTFSAGLRNGSWLRCDRHGCMTRCLQYVMGRQSGNQMTRLGNGWQTECMDAMQMRRRAREFMQRQMVALAAQLTSCDAASRPRLERKMHSLQSKMAQ